MGGGIDSSVIVTSCVVYRLKFVTVLCSALGDEHKDPPQGGEQRGRCNFLLSFTPMLNWHCARHKCMSSNTSNRLPARVSSLCAARQSSILLKQIRPEDRGNYNNAGGMLTTLHIGTLNSQKKSTASWFLNFFLNPARRRHDNTFLGYACLPSLEYNHAAHQHQSAFDFSQFKLSAVHTPKSDFACRWYANKYNAWKMSCGVVVLMMNGPTEHMICTQTTGVPVLYETRSYSELF